MIERITIDSAVIAFLVLFLSIMFSFYSTQLHAAKDRKFLHGCEEVGHNFDDGRLGFVRVQEGEENQTVFFIHNVSYDRIKVQSQNTRRTKLYPIWETTINSGKWAAFATDRDDITFNCITSEYGDFVEKVDCKDVLEVCQFPRAKFGSHNQGNYWVSVNRSKYGTRNEVIRKGVLLKW